MQAALEAAERTVESEEPQHSSAARAILGDKRLRVSLLRLVAFAVRLPAPDGGGADTLRRHQQRAVGHAACRLAAVVLAAPADCYPEAQQSFAEALLQTQTLHAAARQLAACAAALEPGPAPPSPALCVAASHCAAHTLNLLHKLVRLDASPAFSARLVKDMKATQVLEHAARLLLILTPGPANASLQRSAALLAACYPKLLPPLNAAAASAPGTSAVTSTAGSASVPVARSAVAASSNAGALEAAAGASGTASGTAAPVGASASPSGPGRQMEHVAAGPCVQHAVFVFGLKALGELEGGAEEHGGGPCPGCPGSRPAGQPSGADLSLLLHVLVLHLRGAASFSGTAGAVAGGGGCWPRPRTVLRLLLRLGSAIVNDTLRAGRGGQAAMAHGGGGGGGGGAGSGQTGADALAGSSAAGLASSPRLMGPWPGFAEETWRLVAAALSSRAALLVLLPTPEDRAAVGSFGRRLRDLLAACVEEAWVRDEEGSDWHLAPTPLSSLSAALAGGALPLLERLLRRAGEDPAGPEAPILHHAAYQQQLLPLLAHGEPLQAGALVATVTKLLRRTEPLAMMGEGVGAMGLCMAYTVLTRVVDCGEAVQLPDAASPSRGAPSASPAAGRVALVLSLALPEWLPELSRLVRQAAAVDEAAWAEEQAWARRTAAASGGGGSSRGGGGRAEVAEAPAVPPAPAGDLGALMKWMVAVLYHLAQAMVLADGSVPSACSDMGEDDSWWWGSVLEASDVFGLVGSGLRLLERRRPFPQACYFLYELISSMAIRLFALWPECAYEALRAHDPPSACWRPEAVRALGAVMRGLGARPRTLEGLEVMAECLEAWAAGEEAEELPEDLPQAGTTWWAPLLVPPAEARRRLGLPPACSSPACASLAGDSEAGLRRQQCGRCGRASYCCRECQVAHWKAGHKEACGKAAADE